MLAFFGLVFIWVQASYSLISRTSSSNISELILFLRYLVKILGIKANSFPSFYIQFFIQYSILIFYF